MQSRKTYFKKCGQFYLSTKGLDLDMWMEAIDEGHKGDVLTLYGLSLLMDAHTYIHLHNGQFWSTLKNVPSSHDETLHKCKVHALYLGRGLFVELRECEIPLQIIDNPDPKIISIIIGELSELETKTYEDNVHTSLGISKTPESKACTSGTDATPKQGQKPMLGEPYIESPLDLSLEDKDVPNKQPGLVIPLDLSFDQGSDKPSIDNKVASTMQPSSIIPLDLSYDHGSNNFLLFKHESSYGLPATLDTQLFISRQVKESQCDPKLACTVSVDIIKLDLKTNQTVHVMALNQKENKINDDDQDSDSTIIYDVGDKQEGDNPMLRKSHVPEWYIKPRYQLPSSVKSLKKKRQAKFNVKLHGIHCRCPKYWFKCMVSPCKQTFPSTKLWNIHHA